MRYEKSKNPTGRPAGVRTREVEPRSLGYRLREVRESARQEQDEFGRSLGVSKATQGAYERNERAPDATYLLKLCEQFEVSADWLLLGRMPSKSDRKLAYDAEKMQVAMKLADLLAESGRMPENTDKQRWATQLYEFFMQHDD